MAAVEKYSDLTEIFAKLRHNERTALTHSNKNINSELSKYNYRLSPDHGCTDYDYLKAKLEECHSINRRDVVKIAQWSVTAPEDLSPEQEADFFRECRNFLNTRYGIDHEVQAIVHYDEIHQYTDIKTGKTCSSRPHLHYSFIPAVQDKKHGGEKLCAKKVLTQRDLRNFHQDLQRHLDKCGIRCTVYSGVTQKQGGSISVQDLKKESLNLEITYSTERSFEF